MYPSVSVVDYGVGNLGSVLNMFRRIDVEAQVVSDSEAVARAPRLLLPGVGAFDAGVSGLRRAGLDQAIVDAAQAGTPILGICLGMQLLTSGSEEGTMPGLGLLDAECRRLQPRELATRVPHMGWNWVWPAHAHPLVDAVPAPPRFYFAHSFHVVPRSRDDTLAWTDYGGRFSSMVVKGNVCGAQFHPEKSHVFGMSLLSSFSSWMP